MYRNIIFTTLIYCLSYSGFSQVKSDYDEIGFHCSYGGIPTESVKKIQNLIQNKKFPEIIYLMESSNNAEKFLASMVYLELCREEAVMPDPNVVLNAEHILNSDVKIAVCSGCTYYEQFTMKELFEKRDDPTFSFNFEFKNWLKQNLNN